MLLEEIIHHQFLAANHIVMFVSLGDAQIVRNVSEKNQMKLVITVIKIRLQVRTNVFMIMAMMVKDALSAGHKMISGSNLLNFYID